MQQDVLIEAESILRRPSANTKQKILISVNLVTFLSGCFYLITQSLQPGGVSLRNLISLMVVLPIHMASGAYTSWLLIQKKDQDKVFEVFKYLSVIITTLVYLSLLHTSKDVKFSILLDSWIGIPVIIISSLILSKWAGLTVFLMSIGNIFAAIIVNDIGFNFVYDTGWVFPTPQPIARILSLLLTYFILSIAALFFEAGMINNILKVIPEVIERIRLAGDEKKKLEMENMRMGAELDVARKIQMMVLPGKDELTDLPGIEVAAKMEAAAEVGGDYYDVLTDGKSTYFGVGDVTDHGLESGVVMLMVQSAFRTILEKKDPSLITAVNEINSVLYKNNQLRIKNGRNMTLLLAKYIDGTLTVCGQHEKVILIRKNGSLEKIDTVDLGMYTGLIPDISDLVNDKKIALEIGDIALFYTDGASEAENDKREEYGVDRISQAAMNLRDKPMDEMVEGIFKSIYDFIGKTPVYDDITVVGFRRRS